MTAADPLPGVSAARLPAAGLAALAAARDAPGVRLFLAGESVWVTWPPDGGAVARRLVGVFGAEFFARRGGAWHRFGSCLPTSDAPPAGDGLPLAGALLPGRLEPAAPPTVGPATAVRLARGGPVRRATALVCAVAELAGWADTATTDELSAARVAVADGRALVLGSPPPNILGALRLWGDTLLVPLGFRPDPDLPPAVLREAAGAEPGELMILTDARCELVPRAALVPATRAGLRLAGARP